MDPQPLRFQLELDRDRQPIQGRLSDEQGNRTTFTGWLELIALLEKSLPQGSQPARTFRPEADP
jgi:hypothetical protein